MSTDALIDMTDKNQDNNDTMRNIINNFDPFKVLQPIKNKIKPENLLVDLTNSNLQEATNNDLNGSLLETTTKNKFDVIDVFQNMFINPQHVTQNDKETELTETERNRDWIKDFENFNYENNGEVDVMEDLASVFLRTESKPNTDIESEIDDDEDRLIDEVFAMKAVQAGSHTHFQTETVPPTQRSITEHTHKLIAPKLIVNKEIIINSTQPHIPNSKRLSHEFSSESINLNKTTEAKTLDDLNIPNPQLDSSTVVQTVKFDRKKYKKRQILSDEEKVGYTRGPDLLEKSIYLPSMVERIKARKQYHDECKNLRRRLVWEPENIHPYVHKTPSISGFKNESPGGLNPIMLTED
ncbi:uncharacterized protein [Battus philenor]|uniref:uncharacterized protein n=1 Tax=Battus philenor TaxID=42288 RepID=UPI0035CF2325